jgi:hypothetical protein
VFLVNLLYKRQISLRPVTSTVTQKDMTILETYQDGFGSCLEGPKPISSFRVDDYQHFVLFKRCSPQKAAGLYPYDNLEDHEAIITLRSGERK